MTLTDRLHALADEMNDIADLMIDSENELTRLHAIELVGAAGIVREWVAKIGAGETVHDLSKCPQCGGAADNGHDRDYPPTAYLCSECSELHNAK